MKVEKKVVKGLSSDGLQAAVEELVKKGYTPVGHIYMTVEKDTWVYFNCNLVKNI